MSAPFVVSYFDDHDFSIGTIDVHLELSSMLAGMEAEGLEILSLQDEDGTEMLTDEYLGLMSHIRPQSEDWGFGWEDKAK
jgi:hypothetical protein